MLPVIYKIGPLTIYAYGLMLAMAVLVCTSLLIRDGRAAGIQKEFIFDFVFWVVLTGILGARLFFVLLNLSFFLQYPTEILFIQNGGLSWQGGLIVGGAVGYWFIKKNKLAVPAVADVMAPYIALGQSIGRIGCFLNGCCYGHPAPWGIYFPVHADHLHPTQLYSSAGLLTIFFVLKRYRKTSSMPGGVFVLYLMLASILRFGVEFFRADHFRTFWGLSIYQYVCLGVILAGFYVRARFKNQTGR